jgi:CheY-like chemotaxis protein
MTGHSALRMLVLDDNPDDRKLAMRSLERAFPGVALEQVSDRDSYAPARADFSRFDLIVTDYQMRWTTGLDVLREVKSLAPEVPVIMFTATGTQEIAVEAMKAGLDDYVIKSPRHYLRLAVAARICLDRSEIRRRALRSETRLHSLLDTLRVGVLRLSIEGEVVDANRAFRTMLSEQVTHPVLDRARELASTLLKAGDTVESEWTASSPAAPLGSPDSMALSLARVKVNGHDAVDVLAYDLTSLRAAERSLLELNRTLEEKVEQRTQQLQEVRRAAGVRAFHIARFARAAANDSRLCAGP